MTTEYCHNCQIRQHLYEECRWDHTVWTCCECGQMVDVLWHEDEEEWDDYDVSDDDDHTTSGEPSARNSKE